MTYLHFLNNIVLTFGLQFLTYKVTDLSKYEGYPELLKIFGIFLLIQLIKFFLLTLVPYNSYEFSFFEEIFGIILNILFNSFFEFTSLLLHNTVIYGSITA
mmetsp:Transcript_46050/g.56514  ORF Transcript_46050/g.56514 Transcript_46050/m.56514 type:complete len:101 (-) Transcript_46050:94-396(-)